MKILEITVSDKQMDANQMENCHFSQTQSARCFILRAVAGSGPEDAQSCPVQLLQTLLWEDCTDWMFWLGVDEMELWEWAGSVSSPLNATFIAIFSLIAM